VSFRICYRTKIGLILFTYVVGLRWDRSWSQMEINVIKYLLVTPPQMSPLGDEVPNGEVM
jgi:hypothetical protein